MRWMDSDVRMGVVPPNHLVRSLVHGCEVLRRSCMHASGEWMDGDGIDGRMCSLRDEGCDIDDEM